MNERGEQTEPNQSAADIVVDLEEVAERLDRIGRVMASTVLHSLEERAAIIVAADQVLVHADTMLLTANEIKVLDNSFGEEESYWTVFRMFATEKNLGMVRDITSIWDYLAKTYDLSGETPETIQATILDWAEDIETDATERGITGRFIAVEDGFTFAETISSHVSRRLSTEPELPVRTKAKRLESAPIVATESISIEETEEKTEAEKFEEAVLALLHDSSEDALKQAAIKKVLSMRVGASFIQHPQRMLDELVERGVVFKSYRNKVAYLSLEPRADEITTETNTPERKGKIERLDTETGIAILETLAAPGRHFNQRLTLSELWRKVNGAETKSQGASDAEIERLKRACRQLQSMNLITAGGEKMGTGGVRTNSAVSSKRRRSATRQVFKVGLDSQERKIEVQELLKTNDLAELLAQRFVLSQASES